MMEDVLFERIPCHAFFAFHNMLGFPAGKSWITQWPSFIALSDTVVLTMHGHGRYGRCDRAQLTRQDRREERRMSSR